MKFCKTIALALLMGVFGLFLTWQALGQAVGQALPETAANPFAAKDGTAYWPANQTHRDPEMEKLINGEQAAEREVNKLLADYKRTEDDKKRAKIKTSLGDALSKQFDLQQKRRELELSRLEEKLKKVRGLMKKRDEQRKVIIDNRLDQLVRDAEGLGWSPPPGPRNKGAFGNFSPAKR